MNTHNTGKNTDSFTLSDSLLFRHSMHIVEIGISNQKNNITDTKLRTVTISFLKYKHN